MSVTTQVSKNQKGKANLDLLKQQPILKVNKPKPIHPCYAGCKDKFEIKRERKK